MSEQREALAEALYELFGSTLYGHDIGPWDSERVQAERNRWLRKADALLDSNALAQMLADAEQRGADRVAAAVEAVALNLDRGDSIDRGIATDLRAALTTGAADRVRAEEGGDEPRCQYVSPSPWGPTQCALPEGHADRHAYSPSEDQ